ncbi:hypothetical protein [Lysinibacillus sphaericus]|uniref:Uncharacterized protein n=1 Tax=Lysinibacillus sphaericus OT4b.31 TaxID=1285586 RepID=R7Z8N6_LYSSH|nr:hypothetical protein [Lysinibacillus sphaericus]EON70389.1 hypothetical protein H131_21797 [Lysinibacillus sphaericus OT4b.31]
MVTSIVIDRTLQFLRDMPKKAVVTIDGQEITKSFHSQEIVGDMVKTYVYLDDGHGHVSTVKLVDAQGIELDQYTTSIEPSEDGLMIVFTLSVTLKGAVQG